jgi:hypothetical protein
MPEPSPTPTPSADHARSSFDARLQPCMTTYKRDGYTRIPEAPTPTPSEPDEKTSFDLERGTLEVIVLEPKQPAPSSPPPGAAPSPAGWQNNGRLSRPDNCVPLLLSVLFRALVDSFMGGM